MREPPSELQRGNDSGALNGTMKNGDIRSVGTRNDRTRLPCCRARVVAVYATAQLANARDSATGAPALGAQLGQAGDPGNHARMAISDALGAAGELQGFAEDPDE